MHGTEKGRQGRTPFECSKLKKGKPKTKSSRRVFLRTGWVLRRMEGTVVFIEATRKKRAVGNSKKKFSKKSTPATNKKVNSPIVAE